MRCNQLATDGRLSVGEQAVSETATVGREGFSGVNPRQVAVGGAARAGSTTSPSPLPSASFKKICPCGEEFKSGKCLGCDCPSGMCGCPSPLRKKIFSPFSSTAKNTKSDLCDCDEYPYRIHVKGLCSALGAA